MLIHSKSQMNEPKMRAVRQCGKRRKGEKLKIRTCSIIEPHITEHHPVGHEHGYEQGSAEMYTNPPPSPVPGSLYIHHLAEVK